MEKPKCKIVGESEDVETLINSVRKALRQKELYEQLETLDCEIAELEQESNCEYEDVILIIRKYILPAEE